MDVILDASVVIDFLRRGETADSMYAKVSRKNNLLMSLVTVAEIYSGRSIWQHGRQADLAHEMIDSCDLVNPDFSLVCMAGKMRSIYGLSLGDGFIVATAIDMNAPIATLNIKDFVKIKEITLWKP